MRTVFKVFIEFVTILLLFFYVLVFLAARCVGSYLPNLGPKANSLRWKAKS